MSAYNVKVINDIIGNDSTHVVAVFKDYLLFDDINDFMRKSYILEETREKINNITEYYSKYCTVFPNYINLDTRKYLYKNIIRKQRMLNEKHADLIKIKNRCEEVNLLGHKNPSISSSLNTLFDTKYLKDLEENPIMQNSDYFDPPSIQAQILDFTNQSSQLTFSKYFDDSLSINQNPNTSQLSKNCTLKQLMEAVINKNPTNSNPKRELT
jgi:hypothetical protein